MVRIEETLFCDGCGVEIPLSSVVKDGRDYCCEDCAKGYKCKCDEDLDLDERRGKDDEASILTNAGLNL